MHPTTHAGPGQHAAPSTNGRPPPNARWPDPVPITQIPDTGPAVNWLWEGMIARGHTTLFSALMKAGKSTLMAYLLRALQHGVSFLGRDSTRCRTLVISEESQAIWRRRRDTLGLDDSLHLLCRPMVAKPSFADWAGFLAHVRDKARDTFDLVAIDTLSAFAPWRNENDAAEVQATLTPLNQLTEAGHAVLLFHHHGKGDQSEGKAARGSTALAGAVDVLLEMRRYKPDDREDRRRVVSGLGRFDEIPTEVVIALKADGTDFTAEGDRKAIAAREMAEAIPAYLKPEPPGRTADEIHEAMPKDGRPKRGDLMVALRAGAKDGCWRMGGFGKPNSPYRFWRGEP